MRKMIFLTMCLLLLTPLVAAHTLQLARPDSVNATLTDVFGDVSFNPVRTDDPNLECDDTAMFGQDHNGTINGYASDHNPAYFSADDFWGLTEPVVSVEWWGIEVNPNAGWIACSKSQYVITFYEPGSNPGAVLHQETVTPTKIDTGLVDPWVSTPVYKLSADLAAPVSITDGWFSVAGANEGNCWLFWLDGGSPPNGSAMRQDIGTGWTAQADNADLAFCLIGGSGDPNISLTPEVSNGAGPADSVVTHTFTLRNRSGVNDEIDLVVSGNSWTTTVTSSNPVVVMDGMNATVTVDVVIPPGATPPAMDSSLLTATGQTSGLDATATLNTNVGSFPQIDIDPASFNVNVPINETLDETMMIWNTGTENLTWSISVSNPGSRDVGDWVNVSPVATAVQWPGSTIGEGKFFVIGGFTDTTSGTLFNGIQIYDTFTGTWSNSATMTTPVFACGAEYYQGKVYVVGGYINSSFVATSLVQIYDVATNTWTAGATMPTARGGNSSGLIGGVIYSLGGAPDGNFPAANVAYAYDVAANSWTTLNNGPINTYGILLGGAGVLDGKIYFGGHFASAYYQFYEFDPAGGGTWTAKATFPTGLGGQSVSLVGLQNEGIIMGVGGGNGWTATGTTFSYDPAANVWTNLNKPMTTAVLGGGCAAANGEIYFYGGTVGSGPVTPAPFMKNTYTDITWVSANPSSGTLVPGASENVTIHFDAFEAGGVGTYEAWLVVSSNDMYNTPWNVPVVMNVFDGPTPTPPEPTATPTSPDPTATPTPQEPTPTPHDPTPTPQEPTATPTPIPPDFIWIGTDYCGDTGDQIDVEVWMANDTVAVDAFTMAVLFDDTMLQFESGIAGDLDPGWTMFGANEATPGQITVAAFALPPNEVPAGSEGVLAVLTFTVTCSSCTEGDTSGIIPDNLRDDIAGFGIGNGEFTFICPAEPTPTPEPTNTPAPPTFTPVPPTFTPVPPTNTPVPPTHTPTNTPTTAPPTHTPTPLPTDTPPPVPTDTPEPTPTPPDEECDWFGTRLELSQEELYRAGDNFWLKCHVCVDAMVSNVPTAILLGVYGEFWFWPGWTQDFDLMMMDYEPGLTTFYGLDPFTWPTVEGHVTGLEFYAAMLTPDMTNIFGDEFGYIVFGYTNQ